MSLAKDGIMVIFSSPSGAGKTTLVKKISLQKKYKISISYTTREPRTNETNGVDYFFVNKEKFNSLIINKELLEYAKVFNNFYGTSEKTVIDNLENGKNIIFDIDWQGTKQIKEKKLNFKLISFFILPPSKEVLFERLSNRDMKDKLIVSERMKQFDEDLVHWKDYDFVVINDDLDDCYNEIVSLIDKKINNKIFKYDKKKIENHIKILSS